MSPKVIADRLNLSQAHRVLEVGPGSGYLSGELATRIPRGELVLLDLQEGMLSKARQKLESMELHNVRYVFADASRELDCPNDYFNVALLVCVLGEVADQQACLRSLRRVIRADGLLVVHESLPDPDMLKFEALRILVETEGFRFSRRWGYSWNYTAAFKPDKETEVQQNGCTRTPR